MGLLARVFWRRQVAGVVKIWLTNFEVSSVFNALPFESHANLKSKGPHLPARPLYPENGLAHISSRASIAFCRSSLLTSLSDTFAPATMMINHLVFKDRRAQLLLHLRVLLDKFKELTFLPRILTGLQSSQLGSFPDPSPCTSALRPTSANNQPQDEPGVRPVSCAHPSASTDPVVVIVNLGVFFMPQLMRNLASFGFDQ